MGTRGMDPMSRCERAWRFLGIMRTLSRFFTAAGTALLALLLTRAASTINILLTTNSGLKFGQIVATASPGAVTLTPAGFRSASGGAVLGNGFGVSPASFTVTGDPNTAYGITLPGATSLSGGASSMM